MKLVREHIEFERNLDPMDAMDVGKHMYDFDHIKIGTILKIKKDLFSYKKNDCIRITSINSGNSEYCSEFNEYATRFVYNDKNSEVPRVWYFGPIFFKEYFEVVLNPIKESIEFERNLDPLKAMSVGKSAEYLRNKNTLGYITYKLCQYLVIKGNSTVIDLAKFIYELKHDMPLKGNTIGGIQEFINHSKKIQLVKKGKYQYLDVYELTEIGKAYIEKMKNKIK